jgi:hypothetical protein
MSAIPNFPVQGPFLALRDLLFANRVRAETSASAVCFKSNLRAFYLDRQPLTLWIAAQRQSSAELHRAMALRSRLASSPELRTPRIIAQDIDAEPPYVLEELVIGRSFGQREDWVLLVDKVLPSLFRLYDQEYIRHYPAVEIYDAERIYRGVAYSVSNSRENTKWMLPPELLLEAAEQCLRLSDETLPLCTGHGDLTSTNLVVAADGGIVILDWERSRELPIAEELIKLVRGELLLHKDPQLIHRLAPELHQRTEDPVAMPPKRQLLLATLNRTAMDSETPRKAKRWLKVASTLITEPDW